MKVALLLTIPILLFSKIHYAKVEPYERYIIKSAVSGEIILSKIELEGKIIKHAKIVQIDDKLDKIELSTSKEKLKIIDNMLDINQKTLIATKESLQRQKDYYERIEGLLTIPASKKDNAFYNYISTKTKYLSIKEKLENLKQEKLNLKYKINLLKDRISKKSIYIKNRFLYKLLVHKRDFVNIGTPIAKIDNLSKAKLTIFIENDELDNIKSKKVYIDGKETNYKISKIWKTADDKFISSYRAEIIMDKPKYRFSTLLKVELK
jgi:multidrug resistance efflux pump